MERLGISGDACTALKLASIPHSFFLILPSSLKVLHNGGAAAVVLAGERVWREVEGKVEDLTLGSDEVSQSSGSGVWHQSQVRVDAVQERVHVEMRVEHNAVSDQTERDKPS